MDRGSNYIIFLDDDEVFHFLTQQLIADISSELNAEALFFQEPETAMKSIKALVEQRHHVIAFIDLNMPLMNGFRVVDDLIHRYDVLVPVVMLTSSTLLLDRDKVSNHFAIKALVEKPLQGAVLKDVLRKLDASFLMSPVDKS